MTTITGATRLNVIVGDPIAQVKSPAGMTAAFAARGLDAVVVPARVAPADLDGFLASADRITNLDGIIVTVPHKMSCRRHCASVTERGDFLATVNLMRRQPDGTWHGDTVDGLGFTGAVAAKGFDVRGKRALLVGAGGAGSAIALALVEAGVADLAIHDADPARRDDLVARLAARGPARVVAGSPDPTGFDLVAHATPAGMREGDALPIDVDRLAPETFVGCVVTVPVVSPLIAAARARGCPTSTGSDMYAALQEAMIAFLADGAQVG